jgi:hypothetical protein
MKLFLSLIPVLGISLSPQAQTWNWTAKPKAAENVMIHISDVPSEEPVHLVYYGFEGTKLISSDLSTFPLGSRAARRPCSTP